MEPNQPSIDEYIESNLKPLEDENRKLRGEVERLRSSYTANQTIARLEDEVELLQRVANDDQVEKNVLRDLLQEHASDPQAAPPTNDWLRRVDKALKDTE